MEATPPYMFADYLAQSLAVTIMEKGFQIACLQADEVAAEVLLSQLLSGMTALKNLVVETRQQAHLWVNPADTTGKVPGLKRPFLIQAELVRNRRNQEADAN